MDWLNFFADWLNLKTVLITCLIFVPLERVLAMHPDQSIFRRGWWNDLIYLFVNSWLIKLGLIIVVASTMSLSESLLPPSMLAAVAASSPYGFRSSRSS
jgi:hypothetical protein